MYSTWVSNNRRMHKENVQAHTQVLFLDIKKVSDIYDFI